MEQNLLTKKQLKEKSIEYQIPFADLLEAFLQETLMFQVLETDFAKNLWLKNRDYFCPDAYREEWQKPLHFVYGQENGAALPSLDEKLISDFAEEICRKRDNHIRWNYALEKEESDYLVYITGEWEEMKVPLTIRISPLVYDMVKPEKQQLQSVFYEKKTASYLHFPVETYLAEQIFSIINYLELIPSMEAYDTVFHLLKQEPVDGRHIYDNRFSLQKRGSSAAGGADRNACVLRRLYLYEETLGKVCKKAGERKYFLGNSIAADFIFCKSNLGCGVQG